MRHIFLFSLIILSGLDCQKSGPPEIVVEDAWSRPVFIDTRQNPGNSAVSDEMSGTNGVAYLIIKNDGGSPDRLISASSGICEVVELHTTIMEGESMRMQPLKNVDIAGGKALEFKPRHDHVMLINLKKSLRAGDRYELKLHFEKSGDVKTTVEVRNP